MGFSEIMIWLAMRHSTLRGSPKVVVMLCIYKSCKTGSQESPLHMKLPFRISLFQKKKKKEGNLCQTLLIFNFYFSGATRDIGACLTRIVLRHKSMESKLKTLCRYVRFFSCMCIYAVCICFFFVVKVAA